MEYKPNKKIKKIAKNIKKHYRSKEERAKQIHRAVRNNVTYRKRGNQEPRTAREVIDSGYGNCLEQARLYASIANQIPLRVRILGNKKGDHAYPAVKIGRYLRTYDTTTNIAGNKTKESHHNLIHRSNKVFKRRLTTLVTSIALSMTINLTQEHWQPPVERSLEYIAETGIDNINKLIENISP